MPAISGKVLTHVGHITRRDPGNAAVVISIIVVVLATLVIVGVIFMMRGGSAL